MKVGLELGGKDPGYVMADVDLDAAAAGLVDGAYVQHAASAAAASSASTSHRDVYDGFVERAVALVAEYGLGDPTNPRRTSARW